MLPTLSRLSVRIGPVPRFRHRRSSRYLRISPLHLEFQAPLPTSSPAVYQAVPRLRRGISRGTCQPPTRALSPVIPNNACLFRITAAAGTELAQAYSGIDQRRAVLALLGFFTQKKFTSRRNSSSTRRRSVRLSPIAEYSLLQPPVGVRAVSQSRCGGPTSQSRYPSLPW